MPIKPQAQQLPVNVQNAFNKLERKMDRLGRSFHHMNRSGNRSVSAVPENI